MWARSELGRRWRALVALGIIAGIAAGLALAAMAGARRTSTAYGRWRTATAAPDAILFGTQVGIENADYTPVLALPEVVDGGLFALTPVGVTKPGIGGLQPGDFHLYRTLSRPLLVEGRLPNPARVDEIVVNRAAMSHYHLRIGQQLTVDSSTDVAAVFAGGALKGGPSTRATIVGAGDSMMDLIFQPDEPGLITSGEYLRRFQEIPRATNLVVRLKPGTNVTAFHQRAAAAMKVPDIPVRNLGEDRKRITHGTDLERTGLLLFAAAVALAGMVLVGQALTRTVYGLTESVPALRAVGFTGSNVVLGTLLPMTLTGAAGVLVALATAVAFSSRFPVGLARRLDPDLGVHIDWWVLAPGVALLAALVLAASAFAASRAVRAAERPVVMAPGSPLMRAIRRAGPLPVAIGAGLALESGRGERALPVRPAIAGAVAGILGIVGALGLVRGIDDAVTHPPRSGQFWDAVVYPDESHPIPGLAAAVRSDGRVGEVAEIVRIPLDVNGAGLPVYSVDPVRGNPSFVVLHGRAPASPEEAAIGPASAKALHKGIGDQVRISGSDGTTATMKVVGTTLLPQTPHTSFDQGVWVSKAAGRRFAGNIDQAAPDDVIVATARPGVKPAALVDHLHEAIGVEVEGSGPPQDVLFLRNVRTLPRALAAFLAVLAVAALGHALVTAVRRRRHDLAVLRAIGFRPRQSAACIFWQAITVALVGLALGIPIGVVVGRLSWRWVADSTPLLYVAPIAALAILIAIPAAIVLANLLAAYPARRAAGVRPAEVLRTE
jgi:ABC-type lipoprotein release transport system permease subunit